MAEGERQRVRPSQGCRFGDSENQPVLAPKLVTPWPAPAVPGTLPPLALRNANLVLLQTP